MKISSLRGVPEMRAKIREYAAQFPDRVGSAIREEAQIEMVEAKLRTPVDTTINAPHPGQLRDSGMVHEPEMEGRRISVTLSFNTEYAVYVHENPDTFHPIGQWKYLESVLNESRPYMARRIAARLKL